MKDRIKLPQARTQIFVEPLSQSIIHRSTRYTKLQVDCRMGVDLHHDVISDGGSMEFGKNVQIKCYYRHHRNYLQQHFSHVLCPEKS